MISSQHCKEVLKSYNNSATFEQFTTESFDSVLGFLGEHNLLKIFYSEAGIQKNTTFFLKTFPKPSPEHVNYIKKLGVFQKEALLYSNLFHHLQKLYKEPFSPKMYLTDNKEFIILEDLNRLGYKNLPGKSLKLEDIESVLRCLARLHSSSIVFEETRREFNKNYQLIDEFGEEFKEVSFVLNDDHPRRKINNNVLKAVLDCIKTIPELKKYKNVERNLSEFIEKDVYEIIKPSKTYRNTVTHCDLWSNNVMFKKSDQNDKLESVLVDFQFARYIPPVYDVLLTLYLNLSYKELEENFKNLMNYYYEWLKNYLSEHQIEIKRICTIEEFWNCVEFYKKLAIIEATWFGTIAFIGDELADKISLDEQAFREFYYLDRSKHLLEEFKRNEEYKVKIIDLLIQLTSLFN